MKSPFLILTAIFLFTSCKNDKNEEAYPVIQTNETTIQSLEGAWELVSFYNYIDNKVTDSFSTREGYRQVKIYTPTKVMWSKHVPSDSTEWFGYGSYSIEDNKLREVLDYGSEMMSKIIQERKEFMYELDLGDNTFSQIEIDEEGNRIYSENYKRIE
jgi:hypothetical protein